MTAIIATPAFDDVFLNPRDEAPARAPRPSEAPADAPSAWTRGVERSWTPEADARLQARTEALLEAAPLGAQSRDVHCAVSRGVLRLFGTVRRRETVRLIDETVRAHARAEVVANEIRVLGPYYGE